MNIPPESKHLFHALGWVYVAAAFGMIFIPRYITLFIGVWVTAIMVSILGFWAAFKHKQEPLLRRICFAGLASGYIIGAAIVTGRISARIAEVGWMAAFR